MSDSRSCNEKVKRIIFSNFPQTNLRFLLSNLFSVLLEPFCKSDDLWLPDMVKTKSDKVPDASFVSCALKTILICEKSINCLDFSASYTLHI